MKKDIEWLKDQIEKDITSWGGGNPDYFRGAEDSYENVKEWLDQLDEPEVLSPKQDVTEEQAWNKIAEYYPADRARLQSILEHFYYGGFTTDAVVEKPVIPKFVADWIEERKSIADHWLEALDDLALDAKAEKLFDGVQVVYDWLLKNPDKFVDAYRFGYEVEEKQKYRVIFPSVDKNGEGFNYLAKDCYHKELWVEDAKTDGLAWEERSSFTEDEIRDLDKGDILFEHFTVKVEELEE